jgi:mono/diheme cytochrome c family protein
MLSAMTTLLARRLIGGSVCAALASAAYPAAKAQDSTAGKPTLTTLSGVYTDKQAGRGQSTYDKTCVACHATTDYTGDTFRSKYVGGTAFDLFELIRTTMPEDSPGSLTNEQYAEIVAYLFKLNDLPPGTTELPTDKAALKQIKIAAKEPTAR